MMTDAFFGRTRNCPDCRRIRPSVVVAPSFHRAKSAAELPQIPQGRTVHRPGAAWAGWQRGVDPRPGGVGGYSHSQDLGREERPAAQAANPTRARGCQPPLIAPRQRPLPGYRVHQGPRSEPSQNRRQPFELPDSHRYEINGQEMGCPPAAAPCR